MTQYRVEINGETVWSEKHKGPATVAHFPDELTERPESGEVWLYIDDEVVGVQRSQADEDRDAVENMEV